MGIRSQGDPAQSYNDVFGDTGNVDAPSASPSPSGDGIAASGGTMTTYSTPPGASYKSHTFTSSGSFVVTAAPPSPSYDIQFLVQGGGGGCKDEIPGNRAGGSGAGGLVYGGTAVVTSSYAITIGAGGNEANGSNSVLGGIGPTGQTAIGGGAGGASDYAPACNGNPGGCGGGGWYVGPGAKGDATQPTNSPGLSGITNLGYDGAAGNGSPEYGGAGGGTGGAATGQGTNKGPGTPNVWRFGPTNAQTYGAGGSASDYPSTNRNADGGANTGDGASGYADGGSGIVVIRYLL